MSRGFHLHHKAHCRWFCFFCNVKYFMCVHLTPFHWFVLDFVFVSYIKEKFIFCNFIVLEKTIYVAIIKFYPSKKILQSVKIRSAYKNIFSRRVFYRDGRVTANKQFIKTGLNSFCKKKNSLRDGSQVLKNMNL